MSSTLSVRDLCERYGVGEHTVLGWINRGELRAINVGRRLDAKKPRWRITQEAWKHSSRFGPQLRPRLGHSGETKRAGVIEF